MDALHEHLSRAAEELLGRASGPMHVRLLLQPVVSSVLAVRAGLRDARTGEPAFLWTFVSDPHERRRLARSAWKDVGKLFLIGLTLDTLYQLFVLHAFHVLQALLVATACAVVPYTLIRGPATRLTARRHRPGARDPRASSPPSSP